MDFSAIVCTYNRAGNLEVCLGHLAAQDNSDGIEWEVVVVDNNSNDETRATVEALAKRLPITIRYEFEPRQGLNHARNRGVTSSTGKYFAFVDDDISVSRGWLRALVDCLEKSDADAVGSCIHLHDDVRLPPWITPDMCGFLGYQDFGPAPFRMDGVEKYPFGGNMAFNRRVVERIGLFNTRLGRKGEGKRREELFKGAETEYFHRMAATGARIFYTPDAVVRHKIIPQQLTKKYFRTLHFNAGYQEALLESAAQGRRLLGVPAYVYPQFARSVGRYIAAVFSKGPDAAFRLQMTAEHFLGRMLGFRDAARQRGPR